MSTDDPTKPRAVLTAAELRALLSSERCQRSMAEFRELVRRAKPLYIARLCSIPFYAARKDDDSFWDTYIGSRPVAARILVEKHGARLKRAEEGQQQEP